MYVCKICTSIICNVCKHLTVYINVCVYISYRKNRKLDICTAPTKARSRDPAYSQILTQNKIDRQGVRSRESGRQTLRRLWWMVFGIETGREVVETEREGA